MLLCQPADPLGDQWQTFRSRPKRIELADADDENLLAQLLHEKLGPEPLKGTLSLAQMILRLLLAASSLQISPMLQRLDLVRVEHSLLLHTR
jgi:hypothetical protein